MHTKRLRENLRGDRAGRPDEEKMNMAAAALHAAVHQCRATGAGELPPVG